MKKHIINFLSIACLTAFFVSVSAVESESLIPCVVCILSLALFGAFASIYEQLDREDKEK
jgi:hypothetical protein